METIKFSNFKGFGGEHSIDVAPLTLIYGENSAGKSSLLELLRLAWTADSCTELFADSVLEGEGPISLAHRRRASKKIAITRRGADMGRVGDGPWTLSTTAEWAYEPEDVGLHQAEMFAPRKIEYDTQRGKVTGRAVKHPKPELTNGREFAFLLNRGEVRRFLESSMQADYIVFQPDVSLNDLFWNMWDDFFDDGSARPEMTSPELLDTIRPALRSPSTNIWVDSYGFYAEGDFDEWTARAITLRLLADLEGPGPDYLMEPPIEATGRPEGWAWGSAVRIPAIRPSIPDLVNKRTVQHLRADDPENYLNWIIRNVEKVGSSHCLADRVDKGGLREFNAALERLGMPHILRLRPSADNSDLDVWFEDRRSGAVVRPHGVGSGVAQVVPVIAATEFCSDTTLLTIEQPELHLHPRLQANLGEYFVAATKAPHRGASMIVETHSELLILRVLRMIREGTADPSMVAVHYVGNTSEGPQITQMRIGSDGEFIDEWPAGFFEERLDELF